MGSHTWERTWIFLGVPPNDKHPKGLPPVEGLITCSRCGTQVCQQGLGAKAKIYFRPDAYKEWSLMEPKCHD